MTRLQQRAAALERDRGLQRLRNWTVGCVLAAAGLVGFFAVLAAGSIPGRAVANAIPSGDQNQTPSQTPSQAAQPEDGFGDAPTPPPSGFFGNGGGGAPRVASGSS
ncbi:MAG: hypothetical protein J2P45_28220 [Candidatus Dormibacteraeota bacterium]|nr:hypothetical protein [Candidatus Dormibacteraeota bacterium]